VLIGNGNSEANKQGQPLGHYTSCLLSGAMIGQSALCPFICPVFPSNFLLLLLSSLMLLSSVCTSHLGSRVANGCSIAVPSLGHQTTYGRGNTQFGHEVQFGIPLNVSRCVMANFKPQIDMIASLYIAVPSGTPQSTKLTTSQCRTFTI
jgi:hypothetical protein